MTPIIHMQYKNPFLLFFLPIFIFIGGCTAHAENKDSSLIEIYKNDGSLQCEKNSGTSVLNMKRELEEKGIKVFGSNTSQDGMSYMTMCGAPTGKINIYTISASDLKIVQKLGFTVYPGIRNIK